MIGSLVSGAGYHVLNDSTAITLAWLLTVTATVTGTAATKPFVRVNVIQP